MHFLFIDSDDNTEKKDNPDVDVGWPLFQKEIFSNFMLMETEKMRSYCQNKCLIKTKVDF